MPKEISERLWELINTIWKEERMPEDWNRGITYAIFRK